LEQRSDNQRSSGGYKSDRAGSGDRPRYNNDRAGSGDRPRYGDRDNQRSDNARSGDRPRYNKDRDNQRSSGGYKSDRAGSSDRPRYNNDRAGSGDRPRYNNDRGGSSDRPRFNSDRGGDRPRYNDRSDRVNDRDRDDLRDGSSSRPQRPAKFQDRKKDWTKSDGNTGDRPKRFDGDRKPRTAGRPQRSTDQSTSGQREQRHERPRNFDERPPLRAVDAEEPVEELEIAEQAEAVAAVVEQAVEADAEVTATVETEGETEGETAGDQAADEADNDETAAERPDESQDEAQQQEQPRVDRFGVPLLPEGAVFSALDPRLGWSCAACPRRSPRLSARTWWRRACWSTTSQRMPWPTPGSPARRRPGSAWCARQRA